VETTTPQESVDKTQNREIDFLVYHHDSEVAADAGGRTTSFGPVNSKISYVSNADFVSAKAAGAVALRSALALRTLRLPIQKRVHGAHVLGPRLRGRRKLGADPQVSPEPSAHLDFTGRTEERKFFLQIFRPSDLPVTPRNGRRTMPSSDCHR
jgi:hypothetical protein